MPHKSLIHHDIQKVFSYHTFYLFFPIRKRKEFKLFQLLESFKKKVLMHRPYIKKSLTYATLQHNRTLGEKHTFRINLLILRGQSIWVVCFFCLGFALDKFKTKSQSLFPAHQITRTVVGT